jgi:hypothetical protein
MIDAMARLLHQGARVLLAAQHFNMQARQYRGTNFKTVYWPQPQTPDIDLYWFPELGIELVREVLFDELRTRRQMETQVNRNASRRDYERQASALPFLIRASAANFADDPITTGIGDQSFAWGNRLRWDEARLAELGLEAEPLIRTSERTWSFGWKGGYLPDEVYRGLPEADSVAGEGTSAAEVTVLGPQPLAARFRGTFPLPVEPIVREPEPDPETGAAPSRRLELPDRPPAPGELVLVGGSELFKNANLMDPEFRADQLLVNAVVDLALEPELAAVATRRRVPRGLDWIDAATKRTWRAVVLAAGPVALVAFGLLRELWRRRAPRVRVSARAGGARA